MKNTTQKWMAYANAYPKWQVEDVFKYIFQSAFGCEHLVSDQEAVLAYIKREYEAVSKTAQPLVEPLDGAYSRVHLSCLNDGLTPETLARIFCLSAKKEEDGMLSLERKLEAVKQMIESGELPFDKAEFAQKLASWKALGFPAIHHSEVFRATYKPAYRVIANRYAEFLPVLSQIDKCLSNGSAIVAIEGGSASGKSTLADILKEVYACNVFHMDDFFLRPEQRTHERLLEIGGNIDYERFALEVLSPLANNEAVAYRPFDCATQSLCKSISVAPHPLTVIEGVYSMHPSFAKYYDLSVYLKIDPVYQKERILARNSAVFAKRFFEEWIPLENLYFSKTDIQARADMVLPIPIHL